MKIVITGATGMVGKGVLLVALDAENVTEVLSVSRSPLGMEHPKLKEVLHKDFMNVETIAQDLVGFDACMFCLGVSSAGMKEDNYTKLTYDLTTHFAETFLKSSPNSQFVYVTGAGTDSTEKGRTMWARVKGKTENALLQMSFKKAWMFRPGAIIPMRGIRSKTWLYQILYDVFKPFYGLMRKMPKYVTDTDIVGRAMLIVCTDGYETQVLESVDINKVGSIAKTK